MEKVVPGNNTWKREEINGHMITAVQNLCFTMGKAIESNGYGTEYSNLYSVLRGILDYTINEDIILHDKLDAIYCFHAKTWPKHPNLD